MPGIGQGLAFIIVLVTALAGGFIARRLRLPILLGYLVGGIIVGPFGLGLVQEQEAIYTVANLGVVLLLFTLGLEFSVKEILRVGKVAVLGGLCQMFFTTLVIFGVGRLFGFLWREALLFGVLIAESSTAVILKVIMERAEVDSRHGRIAVSLSLVQDLAVVPVIAVLPALGSAAGGAAQLLAVASALLKATLFVVVTLALGLWGLPWVLGKIAGQRSRELFMLSVVTLCLATALGTYFFGLSMAFGAFLAGLMVSQSAFARQALADIIPLRDTFSSVFFVALGMLFSLSFLAQHWPDFLKMVAIVLVVKAVIAGLVIRFLGTSFKTALLAGLSLIPIGEFSFILALAGVEAEVFSQYLQSMIITVALATMLLTPLILTAGTSFYRWLSQKQLLFYFLSRGVETYSPAVELGLAHHAVICGYGSVGSRIAAVLERHKLPYLAIDLDARVISNLRSKNVPCIYGDASNPEILRHAHLDRARVLLCTFPDFISVEPLVRNALRINPKLDIVATASRDYEAALLKGIGVSELVLPQFEGSLEIIRHALHRFGLTSIEIQYILTGLRTKVEFK